MSDLAHRAGQRNVRSHRTRRDILGVDRRDVTARRRIDERQLITGQAHVEAVAMLLDQRCKPVTGRQSVPEHAETTDQRYGIGAVAKLTGLTVHTIRVWERRYQAVVADRAPNGRRVYTAADIEKLRLLKTLTDQGLSISAIAGQDIKACSASGGFVDRIIQAGRRTD